MKIKVLLMWLMAFLMGCGRNHTVDQPQPDGPLLSRGGWKIANISWTFEIQRTDSTGRFAGLVQISSPDGCIQGPLMIDELDDFKENFFKGTWNTDSMVRCESNDNGDQLINLDTSLADKLSRLSVSPQIQLPQHVLLKDLSPQDLALSGVSIGSESLMVKGQTNSAFYPIFRAGSSQLKAIAIDRHNFEHAITRLFDEWKTPLVVNIVQIDVADGLAGSKFNRAVCLNQILMRNNERETYRKMRTSFWTAEEHRDVLANVIRHVMANEFSIYGGVEGAEKCLN
jgi:hypothetical protein